MSRRSPFSTFALMLRNVCYYRRTNLAVVFGCAVGVAALAGSLLVGDSVRGTLHDLAVERLGRVQYTVTTPGFFREELAAAVFREAGLKESDGTVVPAVITQGTAENTATGMIVPEVAVLGVTDDFLPLGSGEPARMPRGRQVIVNEELARDLGVSAGDALLLTVGRQGDAPTDTIFARRKRQATLRSMRLTVEAVIPSRGLGVFSLRSSRGTPRNLYVSLASLQARLAQEGKANTLLVAPSPDVQVNEHALKAALLNSVRLADYGLRLVPNTARGYLSLESVRLVLPSSAVERAIQAAEDSGMTADPASVYLANTLALRSPDGSVKEIPYSIVASIPSVQKPPFGPLPAAQGDCSDALPWGQTGLLNTWAAEDLGAKVGDEIEITTYVADEKGSLRTTEGMFVLRGIVAMEGPGLDSGVVPSFEGVTDAKTMREWDPPFPIDLKIRPEDESYWDEYSTTPKAYLSRLKIQHLWRPPPAPPHEAPSERESLEWMTSVRVAPENGDDLEEGGERFVEAFLRGSEPGRFGFVIDDVAGRALGSAKGSSDFGVLFVSMSMFIVAAAAGLVGLLFRLTIEQRASQYGILMATGFKAEKAAQVLMREGLLLALIGAVLGVPLGVGYAALIILALRTRWAGAAGNFVFSLHATPASLIIGGAAGFLISVVAIRWALRMLRRRDALTLLFGWRALAALPGERLRRWSLGTGIVSLAAAAILLLLSGVFKLLSPTGAFFGAGTLLLSGLLALWCAGLQPPARAAASGHMSLWRLGLRSASRNWLRSLLTSGLIACASFVLVAVAANQEDLTRMDPHRRDSGSGGFALLARSTAPLYVDLNSAEGRKALAFPPEASQILDDATFYGFRVSAGDDISCLNIQRPGRPRILGVPKELIERGGFAFTETSESAFAGGKERPWRLLTDSVFQDVNGQKVIPAIADAASAQWILHVGLGEDIEIVDRHGNPLRLRLVGLLANSLFQSEVLIADEDFRLHFDRDSGYRYNLIETPPGKEQAVAETLRKNLGEHGVDVRRTLDVLAGYTKVQDTYLRTFQSLGALGLVLGTFGIVTVLLRSVAERRSELAMLLALGFRRGRIVAIMLIENGLLLLAGTVVGGAAALVAVAPHLASTAADVNWSSLSGTLLCCVAAGLLSCGISAAVSVRTELLSALRSE